MPRDPSTPHPEDEQAQDERDHHIDDRSTSKRRMTPRVSPAKEAKSSTTTISTIYSTSTISMTWETKKAKAPTRDGRVVR